MEYYIVVENNVNLCMLLLKYFLRILFNFKNFKKFKKMDYSVMYIFKCVFIRYLWL